MKYRVAILRDDQPDNSAKWELACQKANIEYVVVDLLRSDWFEIIDSFIPHFCVCRPPGDLLSNKQIFDQKLNLLEGLRGIKCYPGSHEISIYENKASLAWFLEANHIPHPKTFVSSNQFESLEMAKEWKYPLFAKTLIGASGSGVKKIRNKKEAEKYINLAFSTGIKRRYGPNPKSGGLGIWVLKAFRSPGFLFKRLKVYNRNSGEDQKNIVLFQEYVPHEFEWRIVRIGESWFGYKKLKADDMASGSKQFEYGLVPKELLDFSHKLCNQFNFQFMALDLFYDGKTILVNELQTIFGHKSESICFVDGKPGRYKIENSQWVFEEGMFNTNESYDLRLGTAIRLFNQSTS